MRFNSKLEKMRFKTIIGIFLIYSNAQSQEITTKLNGGISGILYESTLGNGELKAGGGLGLGYTYFFNKNWGISTGIEINYNQNSFKLNDGNTISNYEVDDETSAFEYRVTSSNYKESQHFISFAIPVLAQFRTPISAHSEWYFAFGGKVLLPGKLNSKASADELQLNGYYPDVNLLIDDLPSHGFGKVNNWEDKTSSSLNTIFLLSLETGVTFKLKENIQLYTGIYADYGLSDLAKDNSDNNIVAYDPNGINNTQANGVVGNRKIVQETKYLAAGIQLKLGYTFKKEKELPVQTQIIEPQIETQNTDPKPEIQKQVVVVAETKEITAEQRDYIEKPLLFEEVGNTKVTPELASRLDKIAQILIENKNIDLNITGYTCDIGTEEQNIKIGMMRAESAADYLKSKGVESQRLHLFSKGENEPLVPNIPVENRPLNRRVSLKLFTKQ
jgi:outer membrane protein OmpA-like peptidoglycan-associated protein